MHIEYKKSQVKNNVYYNYFLVLDNGLVIPFKPTFENGITILLELVFNGTIKPYKEK